MARKYNVVSEDEQLISGLPKHMVAASPIGYSQSSEEQVPTHHETAETSSYVVARYWTFHPKPGACDLCKSLEGKRFDTLPERPHPNCRCEIESCVIMREVSNWETYSERIVSIQCDPVFSGLGGALGAAYWERKRKLRQKRDVLEITECQFGMRWVEPLDTEYREYDVTDREKTAAYRFTGGADIQEGDYWFTLNPWTGERVTGKMGNHP